MFSSLSIQQRMFMQLGLSVLLQAYVITGTLMDWSASTVIIGSLAIGITILWLYLDSAAGTKEFVETLIASAQRMATGDLSRNIPVVGNVSARQGMQTMRDLQ